MSPQVGLGLVGAGAGGNRAMAGAAAPLGFLGVAARPRRQLPSGAPLLQRGDHRAPQDADSRAYGGKGQEKRQGSPGLIGRIGARDAMVVAVGRNEESQDPRGGGRDDQADARLGGCPGQRPAADRGGRARRPGCGRAGRMSAVSAARSA